MSVNSNRAHALARVSTGITTPTSWVPAAKIGVREWLDCGRRLGMVGRGVGWWIGDWVNFGNASYGEKYTRAARVTGYDVQTLMNMASVASRIDPPRRRAGLSWSHHAEVAALPEEEQERWLDLAASQSLSVRCLRLELSQQRRAQTRDAVAASEVDDGRTPAALVCPRCGCLLEPDDAHGTDAARTIDWRIDWRDTGAAAPVPQ